MDRWTRADVKRLARKVIGPNARVWVHQGRCLLGIEAPARKVRGEVPKGPRPRMVIAAGGSWAELVDRGFVGALKAYEKAAAEGHVPSLASRREAARAELGRLLGKPQVDVEPTRPEIPIAADGAECVEGGAGVDVAGDRSSGVD
jgi:hypothetical protein